MAALATTPPTATGVNVQLRLPNLKNVGKVWAHTVTQLSLAKPNGRFIDGQLIHWKGGTLPAGTLIVVGGRMNAASANAYGEALLEVQHNLPFSVSLPVGTFSGIGATLITSSVAQVNHAAVVAQFPVLAPYTSEEIFPLMAELKARGY